MADTTRVLNAILTANENVSNALDDISRSLGTVAQSGKVTDETMDSLSRSSKQFAAAAQAARAAAHGEADSLRDVASSGSSAATAKGSVTGANQQLMAAARAADKVLGRESTQLIQVAKSSATTSEFIDKLRNSNLITAEAVNHLERRLRQLGIQSAETSTLVNMTNASIKALGVSSATTSTQVSNLNRQLKDIDMGEIASSLDLGPFNVALDNITGTMVQLIPIVGSLITALVALAGAALAAAAAMGLIFGGGMLVMAQGLANASGDIEDRMEAITEIMQDIVELMIWAFRPLQNHQSVEMLHAAIEALASAVNYVAQAVAMMQDVFQEFQTRIGSIFWEHFGDIIYEVQLAIVQMMPTLLELFDMLGGMLPGAIRYLMDVGYQFVHILVLFLDQLRDFAAVLIDMGVSLFAGALPAFGAVLQVVTSLVEVLETIPDGLWAMFAGFLVVSYAGNQVVGMTSALVNNMLYLGDVLRNTNGLFATFHGILVSFKLNKLAEMMEDFAMKFGMLGNLADNSAGNVSEYLDDKYDEIKNVGDEAETMGQHLTEAFGVDETMEKARKQLGAFRDRLVNSVGRAVTYAKAQLAGFRAYASGVFTSIPPFTPTVDTKAFRSALKSDVAGLGPITQLAPEARMDDFTLTGLDAAKYRFNELRQSASRLVRNGFNRVREAAVNTGGAIGNFVRGDASDLVSMFNNARAAAVSFARQGLAQVAYSARAAGQSFRAALIPALNMQETAFGLRDVDTGQFTSFGRQAKLQVIRGFEPLSSALRGAVSRTTSLLEKPLGALAHAFNDPIGALKTLRNVMSGNFVLNHAKAYYDLIRVKSSKVMLDMREFSVQSALQTVYSRTTKLIYSNVAALRTQGASALFSSGAMVTLRGALLGVANMSIPVISGAALVALNFLTMAGSAGIAAGAVSALSLALSMIGWTQIVIALTAIVGLAALLVGALGNIGSITSSARTSWVGLKDIVERTFDIMVSVGVPVWNAIIDLIWLVLSPVIAVYDGLKLIAESMGLVSSEGTALGSVMDGINAAIDGILAVWTVLVDAFGGFFRMAGNLIHKAVIAPFWIVAEAIGVVIGVVQTLWEWFKQLGFVQTILGAIMSGISQLMSAFSWLADSIISVFGMIPGLLESVINDAIGLINGLIAGANAIPGVDISKVSDVSVGGGSGAFSSAKTSTEEVQDNSKMVMDGAKGAMASGETEIHNNIERNEYNFGDFHMLPEEKARVKGLVNEALNEANRNKRLEGGHIG